MSLGVEEVWAAVVEERRSLADEIAPLGPDVLDRASRCSGWRVRDVLGHLVWLAERSRAQLLADSARVHPDPNRAVMRIATRTGEGAEAGELADRLRAAAGGRGRAPLLPPAAVLGEVLAHRADIATAAGLAPRPADERLRTVLELYRRLWFAFHVPRSIRRVRFEPDGAGWDVGPPDGEVVRGPADEVLLAATGRSAAVEGPGVGLLRRAR